MYLGLRQVCGRFVVEVVFGEKVEGVCVRERESVRDGRRYQVPVGQVLMVSMLGCLLVIGYIVNLKARIFGDLRLYLPNPVKQLALV